MGIPFFILGPMCERDNTSGIDGNLEKGIIKITNYKNGKIAYDLFSQSPKDVITDEQRKFVDSEMGINDCVSKEELIKILRGVK